MSKPKQIDIKHLAKLSNLIVTDDQAKSLSAQLESTLETISTLDELDTTGVEPTSQVTGLVNVFREDKLNPETTFTQQQALKNATNKTHNGYFVVPAVIDNQS